jgi:hypothetical protein
MAYELRIGPGVYFSIPTIPEMEDEINKILKVTGPVSASDVDFKLSSSDPNQACLFSFIAVLATGSLGVIKNFLTAQLVVFDLAIVAIEQEIWRKKLMAVPDFELEVNAVKVARDLYQSQFLAPLLKILNTTFASLSDDGKTFVASASWEELMKCPPVAFFIGILYDPLNVYNSRYDELLFLKGRLGRPADILQVAVKWVRYKKLYVQYIINSINVRVV